MRNMRKTQKYEKCKNAKYLKIDARKDDLKILELLPNLEFVTIYHIKEEDHEYLTLLKNVKVLELHPGYSASKVYLNLNYIKNNYIASINLYDFEIDSELLRKFIHLKELSLVWCKFSNLDFLRDLNNIEILFINTLPFSSIQGIQYLTKLKKLSLFHCWEFLGNRISDFLLIKELKDLRILKLTGTEITNKDIESLRQWKRYLVIDDPKIIKRFRFF